MIRPIRIMSAGESWAGCASWLLCGARSRTFMLARPGELQHSSARSGGLSSGQLSSLDQAQLSSLKGAPTQLSSLKRAPTQLGSPAGAKITCNLRPLQGCL